MRPPASSWIPLMLPSKGRKARSQGPSSCTQCGCSDVSSLPEKLSLSRKPPPCRYHLGLGIYNVQTAVEGMDGNKRSHFLHLCGQLLRLVLIPCHVEGELHPWTRSTALSFAAELDGHVLGTLCAVTMALLTNRLDLCKGFSAQASRNRWQSSF